VFSSLQDLNNEPDTASTQSLRKKNLDATITNAKTVNGLLSIADENQSDMSRKYALKVNK
jgi:hypothetical protein